MCINNLKADSKTERERKYLGGIPLIISCYDFWLRNRYFKLNVDKSLKMSINGQRQEIPFPIQRWCVVRAFDIPYSSV